ncbi:serine hydrolase [Spongiivirga sp. MCCC 1A20706]|uniref:serine hydrolase n=1 Tax=Spongiivirga sp. MCCC 1A20706 TaxID=3160963 RepID=UPI0039773060
MKTKNLKQINVLFVLTLISVNAYCQNGQLSESTSSTIAYSSTESGTIEIHQINANGKSTIKSTNEKGGYLAWSPDGKHFAFYYKYDDKKTWSIHTMNRDGTNRKRLTHEKNKWDNSPTWSPDGKKIVFSRAYKDTDKNWKKELWIMNSDGSQQTQLKSLNGGGPYFTPEGKIVFHSEFKDKKNEISISDIDGKNIIHLTDNEAEDWHPEVSPDGKQIAFMSDRDGNHEIYVMNIDGSNQKRLTNNDFDDWYPSWSPDGSQLIFSSTRNGEKSIYIMNIDGGEVRKLIPNATSPAWLKIKTQRSDSSLADTAVKEYVNSFRDISILKEAIVHASPKNRSDGIPVGKLGIDGGDKAMILKLSQEIADSKDSIFDSFLIAHNGRLLFESYFRRGRINMPHPQASATKTYTGLAFARAIQLGYLTMEDLDKPLVSFLKDLDSTKFVDGVEKITLNHALTSRTGIRISKEQKEKIEETPSLLKGQGEVQALLEHSTPITEKSQNFKYGDGVGLIMQVIEAVVPGSAKDFIKNELFNKIGITNYIWLTDELNGLPAAGWRSSISSRDMMKLGILAMNKGKWNGEQLIPEAFITRAISRVVNVGDDDVFGGGKDVSNQGYGYFWWNADLKVGDKSYFSASAQGGGSQYIILIEELNLIVVFTGHNNHGNGALQITAEHILPAFIK